MLQGIRSELAPQSPPKVNDPLDPEVRLAAAEKYDAKRLFGMSLEVRSRWEGRNSLDPSTPKFLGALHRIARGERCAGGFSSPHSNTSLAK